MKNPDRHVIRKAEHNEWGRAFMYAKQHHWDIYPYLERMMNEPEIQNYGHSDYLQGKSGSYLATMFPGTPCETWNEYSDAVLSWAGYIYGYWIIAYDVTPAYVWSKADINHMAKVWFKYHSIMNLDAVIYNLENEVDK